MLYIAIDICRITDDKYSLVFTIRGSANFTSLQFFWGQWTQALWEQETPFPGSCDLKWRLQQPGSLLIHSFPF